MKKSNIYTKGGDKGTTSLVGGTRVPKAGCRIESYGAIDELNSFTGMLRAKLESEADRDFLFFVQHQLFAIGTVLATDESKSGKAPEAVKPENIARIEKEIDRIDAELPALHAFVIPGGTPQAGLAHVCRTVCRRAEREIYRLAETASVEDSLLVFINRLSDYFFVLARQEALRNGGQESFYTF
jgi:cob(I)alamin adenosyltransferase